MKALWIAPIILVLSLGFIALQEIPQNPLNPSVHGMAALLPKAQGNSKHPKPPQTQRYLSVKHLIELMQLREIFHNQEALQESALRGQPISSSYNNFRWEPAERKGLGFAIQVWKEASQSKIESRFQRFFLQSMGGEIKDRWVGDRCFIVQHHGIKSLVFVNGEKHALVWISADSKVDFKALVAFARVINKRL